MPDMIDAAQEMDEFLNAAAIANCAKPAPLVHRSNCLWCNEPLPPKHGSFCDADCRADFDRKHPYHTHNFGGQGND